MFFPVIIKKIISSHLKSGYNLINYCFFVMSLLKNTITKVTIIFRSGDFGGWLNHEGRITTISEVGPRSQ